MKHTSIILLLLFSFGCRCKKEKNVKVSEQKTEKNKLYEEKIQILEEYIFRLEEENQWFGSLLAEKETSHKEDSESPNN